MDGPKLVAGSAHYFALSPIGWSVQGAVLSLSEA